MIHPTSVDGMEAKELARKLMITTYDYHLEFFKELIELYAKESDGDKRRGYEKLSKLLSGLSDDVSSISDTLEEMWGICEPHTNK